MVNIYIISIMLLGHWFGDFVLQSNELALKKHKTLNDLALHSFDYSAVFLVIGLLFTQLGLFGFNLIGTFLFFGATFLLHALVDHTMSKIGYDSLNKSRQNEFLGFLILDQSIHLILLWFTFVLIF